MEKQRKKATIGIALIPIIFLIVLLALANMVNNVWETGWVDAHIPLLFGALSAALVAMFILDYTWAELEEGVIDLIKSTLSAIIILLVIGCLTGTWLASGIVPAMIFYGIQIIHPSVFFGCHIDSVFNCVSGDGVVLDHCSDRRCCTDGCWTGTWRSNSSYRWLYHLRRILRRQNVTTV